MGGALSNMGGLFAGEETREACWRAVLDRELICKYKKDEYTPKYPPSYPTKDLYAVRERVPDVFHGQYISKRE